MNTRIFEAIYRLTHEVVSTFHMTPKAMHDLGTWKNARGEMQIAACWKLSRQMGQETFIVPGDFIIREVYP